jgi:hypothetical protein
MEHSKTFTIQSFVEDLFSKSPRSPCTINFMLHYQNKSSKLEVLTKVLVLGARQLYGKSIQPENLTTSQFEYLQSYFNSFGQIIKYKKIYNENNQLVNINIWFEEFKRIIMCDGRIIYK